MGVGTRILGSPEDYDQHCTAGHMWMTLLTGRHMSSDAAVVRRQSAVVATRHRSSGRWRNVRLLDHSRGRRTGAGSLARPLDRDAPWRLYRDGQPRNRRRFDHRNPLARQAISGRISMGADGSTRSIHLYSRGEWVFADRDRRDGYSVVLFDRRDVRWRHPSRGRSKTSGRSPPCRAYRSLSTRIAIRHCTRCPRAASGSRSSTAGTSRSASPLAIGCACIS